MGFGVAVLLVGVWILGQPLDFAAAYEFDALACIIGNNSIQEADVAPDVLKWAQEGVDAHNKRRKKHGTPPLVLNQKMCRSSQWTANYNAKTTITTLMIHTEEIEWIGTDGMKCGENLMASGKGGVVPADQTVQAWYHEISRYDFAKNAAKPGQVVGHFLNVVWKATKEMCMTYAQAETGEHFYVAQYFPPAGYPAEVYAENVLNPNNANNDHCKTGVILMLILCVQFF